jgi:hypothetical protein
MRYWKEEKIVYADAQLGIFVADFADGIHLSDTSAKYTFKEVLDK